ncbi:MAG: hypothetical protein Q8882_02255 [Bacillota bacterium]|nr:hypothetical protein [Bacillota bacterium]
MGTSLITLCDNIYISPLSLKEGGTNKGDFYAAGAKGISLHALPTWVKATQGYPFVNFYMQNSWYEREISYLKELPIPDKVTALCRKEAYTRSLEACALYLKNNNIELAEGELEGIGSFNDDFASMDDGLDGIYYLCTPQNKKYTGQIDSPGENDAAFYLYNIYRFTESASRGQGPEALTASAKELIKTLAMAEIDIIRAVYRKDTSVLYRRIKKAATCYYDYYYEGGINKENKGQLSIAFNRVLKLYMRLLLAKEI